MEKKEMTKKSKFVINVPVFVSKRHYSGDMFDLTYMELVDGAEKLLKDYNSEKDYIIINKKNKFFQRQIGNININKCFVGETPALLINVSAYTLNREGEHIKDNQTLSVEKSDRIGDDKNYYLLLPEIVGGVKKHYNWLAFIYDDPSRESEMTISILKSIMNEIIRQPIKNIKLPKLLEELKKASAKITLNLNSVSIDENEVNTKFKVYQTEFKAYLKQEFRFAGMPIEKIEELIKDRFGNRFIHKILKFIVGNKEYRIKQESDNFKYDMNLLVEQHFNFSEHIATEDIDRIYEQEFILEVMEKVCTKYFTNGEI